MNWIKIVNEQGQIEINKWQVWEMLMNGLEAL